MQALFVLLIAVVAFVPFQGRRGQDDPRLAKGFGAAIASIADTSFDSHAAAALAMCQNLRQGFAVIQVLRMADHVDYDVGLGLGRGCYRDFVAVFVGFVILADAVHVRLMQRINFIVVLGF